MELRGLTCADDKPVDFKLDDCPCLMSQSVMALLGRENSPLLKTRSIHRGVNGVYEGDSVFDTSSKKYLGYIVYNCGFCVYKADGSCDKIPTGKYIKIKHGRVKDIKKVCELGCRTPMLFKYKRYKVAFEDFVAKMNNGLILLRNVRELVLPERLKPITGFVHPNGVADICDGEEVFGGTVMMDGFQYYVRMETGEDVLLENLTGRKYNDGV